MSHMLKSKNRKSKNKEHEKRLYLKNYSLFSLLLCFLIIGIWGCATTKNIDKGTLSQDAPAITAIEVQDRGVTITANAPFVYTIYKPDDPYKIIVDMPDMTVGTLDKKMKPAKSIVTEIIPSQIKSPSLMARVELLLQTPGEVEQEYKNNVLNISIKEEKQKRSEPVQEMKSAASSSKGEDVDYKKSNPDPKPNPNPYTNPNPNPKPHMQSALSKATEITGISFGTAGGDVKVLIQGNGSMIPNVFPLDNRIVIDINDVTLNAPVPTEVVSPVKGIRTGKHEDKVRIVIDMKEKTSFDVAAIGDSIIVTLNGEGKIPSVAARGAGEETEYMPGSTYAIKEPEVSINKCEAYLEGRENVNFDFQDQDIVPVLRLFADISGCNLFIHPDVKGKATMKFRDVAWNQALDTILNTFSLGKSVDGNIIRIAPNTVFTRESEEARKAKEAREKAMEELAPLERETFHLTYANAEDIKQKLLGQKILSKYDETTKTTSYEYSYDEKQRILSPRGNAVADKIANSVTVADIPQKLSEVDDFVKGVDQPVRQVLIEARIVEIDRNTERQLGIQWGVNLNTTNTLLSAGGLSGTPSTSVGAVTGGNYLVDFPSTAVAPLSGSGITFGLINPERTLGLDLQLSAIETIGSGKIITNPKVLTLDREPARILQGNSVPVRKLTAEGTVSTEYKDVVMELNVTPSITREQTLDLAIEIKKEDIDFTLPSNEGAPATTKKEAKTKVRIQDGETIVIGGLYKITTVDTDTGVPGLMKIPFLKWLFKGNTKRELTGELLIFITPHIVIAERPK
jgi:type IV pilus secretin PilQ/predicted competence protein